MFDKKPKPYTELLGKTNRIVEGTIIKGDIIAQTDCRFDGELIGNFKTSGKIVIGPSGIITGDITCKNADIEGTFNGNIEVSEILNVKTKAVIHGIVKVGKLSVEPGAEFSATCTMLNSTDKLLLNDGKEKETKE